MVTTRDDRGGLWSRIATRKPKTPRPPGAPTGLVATGGPNSVALSWAAPASSSAVTGYHVYRNGSSYITLGVVLGYLNSGLTNGLSYSYAVAAISAAGEGLKSNVASATPVAAGDVTPPTISGVAATNITTAGAFIAWSLNEGATGQVAYGTTPAYGSLTAFEPSYLMAHRQPISGLLPGTTYYVRISSVDAAGNLATATTTFTTATPPALPGAPTGLVATGGPASVGLTWSAPSSNGGKAITGYRVYRNGTSLYLLGVVLSYNDTGLTDGQTYSYTVAAVTSVGEGPQSTAAIATPPGAGDVTPPTVSAVTVSGIGQNGVTVACTTNEPATVIIEYGTTTAYGSQTAATQAGTLHSRTLTGLTAGQVYQYRILATDIAGNVLVDINRSFTTTPAATLPGAPIGLTATGGDTSVALAWSAPASNGGSAITGYRVYRNGVSLATPGVVLSYNSTGLTNGQTYTYTVAAITAIGEGPQGNSASATPSSGLDTVAPIPTDIVVSELDTTSARVSWSQAEAGTGQVHYGESTAYGQTTTLEPSLLTAHSQPISGLLPSITYHFAVETEDAAGNVGLSTDRTFTTTPSPPSASAIYGPGISGDGLGNTRFQGGIRIQTCRFRAEQSSALNAFTFYYLGPPDPGYALGTGGTWKAEIKADDGLSTHYPVGAALATQNVAALGGSDADRVITFASPATLVAGTLYHLVFTLTDASPDANHFSTDHWFTRQLPSNAPEGRIVPRFSIVDWAHMYYEHPSGPWVTRSQYTPILDLAYANGQHQGMSYGEAQYGPNDVGEIDGTSKMVRERFTVSGGNRSVTGAGVRLLRQTGSGSGPLTVRLETDAGVLIDSFDIPAASFATGPAPTGANNSDNDLGVNAKWLAGVFSQARTLVNGTTYRLRLSSPAGSKYWAWTNRRLSESYGNYTAATAFQDGYAEVTTSRWSWSPLGVDPRQYDLQFYFPVV